MNSDERLRSILNGEIANRLRTAQGTVLAPGLLEKIWAANSSVPQTGSSDPCKLIKLNADFLSAIANENPGDKS